MTEHARSGGTAMKEGSAMDAEKAMAAALRDEYHRVVCMRAKHRSWATSPCRTAGPNMARGLTLPPCGHLVTACAECNLGKGERALA